jgi:calcium permeable stress-gated cation channel
MIFVVVMFCLFYFTYLYNFLFIYEFTTDTGGLAFPRSIYQTMTGLYFAEICLFGLFFITPGARPQGVVMVLVLVLTVLFHIKLRSMFDPLIPYLPIDIQEELLSKVEEQKIDNGTKPDEEAEFQGQQERKMGIEDTEKTPDTVPQLEKLEFESPESSKSPRQVEFQDPEVDEGGETTRTESRLLPSLRDQVKRMNEKINIPGLTKKRDKDVDEDDDDVNVDTSLARKFAHELTHEELIAIAFQHEALRARPPILWIPDDELGIAKDEIRHTRLECGDEIEISCDGARLDSKGNIIWVQNPLDYVYVATL